MWITVRFDRPLPGNAATLIAQIPGTKFRGETLSCPDHALPLVRAIIQTTGVVAYASSRSYTPRITRIPCLREWVPKFMTAYQKEGVAHSLTEWGAAQSGMFVWAAGSGKTLASQAWACAVGPKHRTVCVTKSAVRIQWRDEAERFTESPAEALDGQKPGPLPSYGFVVIGYDVLPYWINELVRWRPDSVIFDESHKVKNRKRWDAIVSKPKGVRVTKGGDFTAETDGEDQTRVIATITPAEPEVAFSLKGNQASAAYLLSRAAKRRLDTTATPISDRVRDLWAQLDLVRPAEFGSFLGPKDPVTGESLRQGFAWRYCNAMPGQFGGVDDRGQSNLDELKTRLRSVCHYVPFSVANRELPPKRRRVVLVRVSEQVRPGAVAEDIRRAARSGQRAAIVEARLWEAASRKRRRIAEIVANAVEQGQKVCILTGRRRDCEELEETMISTLDSETMAGRVWMAHGVHSDVERRRIQTDYMAATGPAVLIGTMEAWGEGLNLQDTDLGIVAMLPYTPRLVVQVEGRWARLGQSRPVEIVYLIAESTIDERVAQILLRKLPAVEKATDTDEVKGIATELAGADDETLIAEIAAAVGGGAP